MIFSRQPGRTRALFNYVSRFEEGAVFAARLRELDTQIYYVDGHKLQQVNNGVRAYSAAIRFNDDYTILIDQGAPEPCETPLLYHEGEHLLQLAANTKNTDHHIPDSDRIWFDFICEADACMIATEMCFAQYQAGMAIPLQILKQFDVYKAQGYVHQEAVRNGEDINTRRRLVFDAWYADANTDYKITYARHCRKNETAPPYLPHQEVYAKAVKLGAIWHAASYLELPDHPGLNHDYYRNLTQAVEKTPSVPAVCAPNSTL